jgi:hypothetical protein
MALGSAGITIIIKKEDFQGKIVVFSVRRRRKTKSFFFFQEWLEPSHYTIGVTVDSIRNPLLCCCFFWFKGKTFMNPRRKKNAEAKRSESNVEQ